MRPVDVDEGTILRDRFRVLNTVEKFHPISDSQLLLREIPFKRVGYAILQNADIRWSIIANGE